MGRLGLGIGAFLLIWANWYLAGLAAIAANRLVDGLDGSVARATRPTDKGAFLDITLDFVFYTIVPLAFALADPGANALSAAVLIASFVGTGTSFFAFSLLAERKGLRSTKFPAKGIYYVGALAEGAETIAVFVAMCLFPTFFAEIAYGFAALCVVTTALRLRLGLKVLGDG